MKTLAKITSNILPELTLAGLLTVVNTLAFCQLSGVYKYALLFCTVLAVGFIVYSGIERTNNITVETEKLPGIGFFVALDKFKKRKSLIILVPFASINFTIIEA